jgi:hypothetical protein
VFVDECKADVPSMRMSVKFVSCACVEWMSVKTLCLVGGWALSLCALCEYECKACVPCKRMSLKSLCALCEDKCKACVAWVRMSVKPVCLL